MADQLTPDEIEAEAQAARLRAEMVDFAIEDLRLQGLDVTEDNLLRLLPDDFELDDLDRQFAGLPPVEPVEDVPLTESKAQPLRERLLEARAHRASGLQILLNLSSNLSPSLEHAIGKD